MKQTEPTASKQIKRLYKKQTFSEPTSLKDFAVELQGKGNEQSKLVAEWFGNKSGERSPKKSTISGHPKPSEPEKKSAGKKR